MPTPERWRLAPRPRLPIRQRRKSLGLTQDSLADLAGCSARFVRLVEAGKTTVRLDKLNDVLEALGLELTTTVRSVS